MDTNYDLQSVSEELTVDMEATHTNEEANAPSPEPAPTPPPSPVPTTMPTLLV